MLTSPSAASREFGSPPPRASSRRRRRRRLMLAAAVLGLGLAAVAAYAWRPAAPPAEVGPRRQVATRVFTVAKALERHAARAERRAGEPAYPRTGEFMAFVKAMPDGASLLANPYGEPPQAALVAAGGQTGLPTAAQHRDGKAVPLPGTVLGPGMAPAAAYSERTFGALVYDHDPETDSFVLYGVGRAGEQAVVAAATDSQL